MDSFLRAFIQVHVHIDAGQRVWCKNVELPVHLIGSEKKVVLPISKQTFTFDDLKRAGARVDVVTLKSLAQQGAEGRWRDNIKERKEAGLPSNVYIANARSIQYAIDRGKTPPSVRYVGRKRDQITEVYDTVDEVIEAMNMDKWRKDFARGGKARRNR